MSDDQLKNYKNTGKNALLIYFGPGIKLFILWRLCGDSSLHSSLSNWHN